MQIETTYQIKIGVMGSASSSSSEENRQKVEDLADHLGQKIAKDSHILVTGELDGIPGRIVSANKKSGGFSVGVSPAHSKLEHEEFYPLPPVSSNFVVYTGFGFKGRNVVTVRCSDIVIVFAGGVGTLNELTIAYDEGKIIGFLKGTGGVADIGEETILKLGRRSTGAVMISDSDPESLIDKCVARFLEHGLGSGEKAVFTR